MTQRRDTNWDKLASEMVARVRAHTPDWTNAPDSDPGITLVELFAFLGESILERPEFSTDARQRLGEVMDRLQRAAPDPDCPDKTLTRVRFFHGQLLTAGDFEQEQRYLRDKHRRHNRLLHGTGVVRGLDVALDTTDQGQPVVTVAPGVAISPLGDELVLCDPVRLDPCPDDPTTCSVAIGLAERTVAPTPGGPSRVEETAEVAVGASVREGHLTIARLVHDGESWRVDGDFEPARIR